MSANGRMWGGAAQASAEDEPSWTGGRGGRRARPARGGRHGGS